MKRVHIITNTDERCGNAEYARDLAEQLRCWYNVSLGGYSQAWGSDVVIYNWHPAVVICQTADIRRLQEGNCKVIIIHQNSQEHGEAELFRVADAVVAHEPMTGDKVRYIPHGIPVVDDLVKVPDRKIGTAGFPFSWKRMDVAAKAAKQFGLKFMAVAPEYPGVNTDLEVRKMLATGVDAEITRTWLPTEEVVRRLSGCMINIFWFQSESIHDQIGQTGSARMGVAAQRPMIISRHRKFRTMLHIYEPELYVADSEEDVYRLVGEILEDYDSADRPIRQYGNENWSETGEMYRNLIEELTGAERNSAAQLCV